MCHYDGFGVRHCRPCCEFTYEKYIDKDGNIDMNRYNKLKNEKSENPTN